MIHTLTHLIRPAILATAMTIAAPAWGQIDPGKPVVVLPFESTVRATPGFVDTARTIVSAYLKDSNAFAAVLTSDDAKGTAGFELGGRLVEFKAGNMATRMLVGLGSGRSSAAFDFELKDSATGHVLWRKTIKEKASVWSNSASSSAQHSELPDKIAKTLVEELQKLDSIGRSARARNER